MRGYALIGLAAVLVAGTAFATLGEVVGSFVGPYNNIRGVGRSTGYLYVLGLSSPNLVYRCNPTNGSVYGSWATPYITTNFSLTVTQGEHVWVGCDRNYLAYECDGFSGSVYSSWPTGHDPYGLAALCTGEGGQGTTAIFSYDESPNFVFTHNVSTGSILGSFPLAHATPYDFAYDHRNKLLWKYYHLDFNIYGYDPTTGGAVASFARPYPSICYSLAYYGEYLWISARYGNIFVVHCPRNIGVHPASLGKVKALFR
jgi:hypothetical protein